MAAILNINLPLETVAAIQRGEGLEKALQDLSYDPEFKVIHEITRGIIDNVNAIPFTLVPKAPATQSPATAPVFTPSTERSDLGYGDKDGCSGDQLEFFIHHAGCQDERFVVDRHTSFDTVAQMYADRMHVERSDLSFTDECGHAIGFDTWDEIDSLGITDGTIILAASAITEEASEAIIITIRGLPNSFLVDDEIEVGHNDTLSVAFTAYAERVGTPLSTLSFTWSVGVTAWPIEEVDFGMTLTQLGLGNGHVFGVRPAMKKEQTVELPGSVTVDLPKAQEILQRIDLQLAETRQDQCALARQVGAAGPGQVQESLKQQILRLCNDEDTLVAYAAKVNAAISGHKYDQSVEAEQVNGLGNVVEPGTAYQIEITVRDAMNREHFVTIENNASLHQLEQVYAATAELAVGTLEFQFGGYSFGMYNKEATDDRLDEYGIEDGSLITVCPAPKVQVHLFHPTSSILNGEAWPTSDSDSEMCGNQGRDTGFGKSFTINGVAGLSQHAGKARSTGWGLPCATTTASSSPRVEMSKMSRGARSGDQAFRDAWGRPEIFE